MRLFKIKKESKVKQQEVVQEVLEKAEEEYKTIKEQHTDEKDIRQKAIEHTAKRILKIFKESPRYTQYVQDIARTLAEESELPTDVVVEMIKGTIEQEELPNNLAKEMAQILPDDKILSTIKGDNDLKIQHKEVLVTGIDDREKRLKAEKDIRTQKEIEEEQRLINILNKIYKECEDIPERLLVDEIRDLKIKDKTDSIQTLLDKIVARKIASDYSKYGVTKLETLKDIVSIEDMYEYNIGDMVQEEYQNRILQGETVEKKYSKREFEDNLLRYIAKDIAKKFFATSKYIIPPLKRFRNIEKRERDLFLEQIQKETSKPLTKMQISDIEGQMQGIIGTNAEIEDLAEKLFETTKTKTRNVIKIANDMINEDDRVYNTIMALQNSGILENLVKMPKEKRETYISAFANFIQDRKIKNKNDRKKRLDNIKTDSEKPDTHGEENR